MLIVAVDFDGTLALGNKSHITLSEPNFKLIQKLHNLKKTYKVYIKIVTARGSKNKLSQAEKEKQYLPLIKEFCRQYNIPYDEISFNKEYAHLYIDDMTIDPFMEFSPYNSDFTNNKIIFTPSSVIKHCNSSLLEKEWYNLASYLVSTPTILFCNDEVIITKRIHNILQPSAEDIISLLDLFKNNKIPNFDFITYVNNLFVPEYATEKTKNILESLPAHEPTFFHGDFSISNILKTNDSIYLIDPNYKYIFGSYITDAGKAFFSFIAYSQDLQSAKKISDYFGSIVLNYAVSEGCRVCKYKPEYISIVNNIADMI